MKAGRVGSTVLVVALAGALGATTGATSAQASELEPGAATEVVTQEGAETRGIATSDDAPVEKAALAAPPSTAAVVPTASEEAVLADGQEESEPDGLEGDDSVASDVAGSVDDSAEDAAVTDPGASADAAPESAEDDTAEAPDPADDAPAPGQAAVDDDSAVLLAPAHAAGWNSVDGSWYWYADGADAVSTGWLVTDSSIDGSSTGLQRYWLDTMTGALALDRLVSPDEGSGWWAFATSLGYVVRGRYVDPATGYVYYADNDGRLADPGWLVTDAYGDGLQRYYIDGSAHAAVPGYSSDGYAHYTTSAGYVLRGAAREGSKARYANNDGLLATNSWVVTGDLAGGALQRYWAGSDGAFATGLIDAPEAGYLAWAKDDFSVVRGRYLVGDELLVADNDGRLATTLGWVVTDAYDGQLQRYWFADSGRGYGYARLGLLSVDGAHYYVVGQGYVLRGKLRHGGGMLLADNDGVLAWDEGWLVTDAYDGQLQRYRIDSAPGTDDYTGAVLMGAHLGLFDLDGATYYGSGSAGYLLRNGYYFLDERGLWYQADNDGRLTVITTKVGYQNPSRWPQVSAYDVRLPSYCTGFFTYVMPCRIRPDATRSQCVETFISAAMDYLGTRWVDNRCSYPGDTIDCSGLVLEGLYACGMSLDNTPSGDYNPWTKYYRNHHFANDWRNYGVFCPVSLGSIQRGDLIYFQGHVAIYLGGGQILDASSVSGSTTVHAYWQGMYGGALGAARPFV